MFENEIVQMDVSELDSLFGGSSQNNSNETTSVVNTNEGYEGIEGASDEDIDALFNDKSTKVDEDKPEEKVEDSDKPEEKTDVDEDKDEDLNELDDPLEPDLGVLKSTMDFLIEKGIWEDFDGREDLEMTQEIYAEIAIKQAQELASDLLSELVDSTGSYGKAIINHIKSGGNPDDVIDLFKEQKIIDSMDTSTDDSKQAKIERYYKEVVGWKSEKIRKHVNNLLANDELESEFDDIEEGYETHFKNKLALLNKQADDEQKERELKSARFVESISTELDADLNISATDKKLIYSAITDLKHKLSDGRKVNDFALKFAEMQKDPKKYIKLVRFVIDDDKYDKALSTKVETKVKKDTFNFIKGNKSLNNIKSAPITSKSRTQSRGTNFSMSLK